MKLILGAFVLLILDLCQSSEKDLSIIRTKRQTASASSNAKRIVCYYANWAVYRTGESKFGPENINPHLCTHAIYAFATLEKDVGLVPFDPKQDIQLEGYAKFIDLKTSNPNLKLMLSVGGSKEGSAKFSRIAADPQLRSLFAKNSRIFLKQFGFDGLDLAWQYPNFNDGSSSSDKENYVQFVKEIRDQYKDEFLISMVVPSLAPLIARGFDLPNQSKLVDFMNVIAYDYHVATEPSVAHVAPLYPIPEDPYKDSNIDTTIKTYLKQGADPSKLNLGIPLYGTFFILEDPEETDLGANTEDEGDGSQERGAVIYNNFCKKIKEELWTVKHVNKSAVGPYAYKDKRWVAYDDEDMIRTKARYANEQKLGGLMFWSVDMDDFNGTCHSRTFPLIKAGRETFFSRTRPSTSTLKPSTTSSTTSRPKPTPITEEPTSSPTKNPPRITPRPFSPRPAPTRQPPVSVPDQTDENNLSPGSDSDTFFSKFPDAQGKQSFQSNRDILFQNIKVWITNHYYQNK